MLPQKWLKQPQKNMDGNTLSPEQKFISQDYKLPTYISPNRENRGSFNHILTIVQTILGRV